MVPTPAYKKESGTKPFPSDPRRTFDHTCVLLSVSSWDNFLMTSRLFSTLHSFLSLTLSFLSSSIKSSR